jgi:hypothetical protein
MAQRHWSKNFYHTVVRTTGRILLALGNLVGKRPVQAEDGKDTAAVLATLSRQWNEWHPLASIPFLCWFQKFNSQHSEYPPLRQETYFLATQGAKFPCLQSLPWILTHVLLYGHLYPGCLFWYKRRATTALPSAKPYKKCIAATSLLEYIVATNCNYRSLSTQLRYVSEPFQDCVGLVRLQRMTEIICGRYESQLIMQRP